MKLLEWVLTTTTFNINSIAQVCDVQQTIAHLEKLKVTPGYESLMYYPKFIPSPDGQTRILKHIGIIMSNAEKLMKDYGGVLYTDATFGLVIQLFKALLVVVVDGEGHNHLVACFLTPGHDEDEWRYMFDSIAKIPGVDHMAKIILRVDDGVFYLKNDDIF